jgi:hypothetical protein
MLSEQTQLNIAHAYYEMRQAFQETQYALQAPHALMRPRVFPDGDRWCALFGENLQEGVAGFGKTPEHACADFDHNWRSQTLANNPVRHGGAQPRSCL